MNTLENRRILIVDDQPEIHRDFRTILSERPPPFQFALDFAFQGEEALAKVCAAVRGRQPYALAFVDMDLPPGGDGVKTINRLWEQDPMLQVVLCFSHTDCSWEELQATLNTRDRLLILKKPFDAAEVCQLAQTLICKWHMAQQATLQVHGLETAIQSSNSELEEVQAKLMKTMRHAGMVEVATNVLHNVGNVLNSINISVGVVNKTMRASKIDNLSKVTQMLNEHAANLDDFLTRDQKGKLLPRYLMQLETALEEERQHILTELVQIAKSVDHIKEIVAMQQSYSGTNSTVETVRINELVDDALRMNTEAFMRHQVSVVREYSEIPPLPLDKHRILLIIINLTSNAKQAISRVVKEAPDGTHQITIRTQMIDKKCVRIQVADQGEGIAPENLARVFDHGFTTRKNGHGFGLHSCALTAKEIGGTLTVHSDGPGKGAVFTLDIPVGMPAGMAAGMSAGMSG
jgi:signal transduction histidine kinase